MSWTKADSQVRLMSQWRQNKKLDDDDSSEVETFIMTQLNQPLTRRPLFKAIVSALVGLAGTMMVVGAVVTMNGLEKNKDNKQKRTNSQLITKAKKKPKKKRAKKSKPKRKVSKSKPKAPPPPALSAGLGSAAIALDGLGAAAMMAGSDQLLKKFSSDVMTEDSVDQKPRVVRRGTVVYPARARSKGIEGVVELSLLINERGEVESIRILNSTPDGVFEESAKQALEDSVFRPATYKGQPVKVWATQVVNFQLS
jgi:protein TonB